MARSRPMAASFWLRGAALVFAGSVAVHELRYLAGYGAHTEHVLSAHGHAYLPVLQGAVALLVAAGFATFVAALRRARRTGEPGTTPSPVRTWLAASAALTSTYVAQESLEGLLAAGHPAGLGGVVGDGGWTAFLLAVVVGALIALALRAAGAAVALAARGSSPERSPAPVEPPPRPPWVEPRAFDVLACHLGPRAPPHTP